MDRYQMNRSVTRPYQSTCGMGNGSALRQPVNRQTQQNDCNYIEKEMCNCHIPGISGREAALYDSINHMPVGMGYVPCQIFSKIYDMEYALQVGTLFPELCKPFCGSGKRGGCK